MADAPQIRVVISATAAELRSALKGAGRDVDSLSAQIKAVPDRLNIDVRAQTAGAISQLQELSLQAEAVPDLVTIVASADIAPAMAKLALLEAQTAAASRDVRISASGGGIAPRVPVSTGGGGGGTTLIVPRTGGDGGGGGGGGLLSSLGWGAGFAGFAGVGSALSFAGLDFVHVITTALSVAGSAISASIGASLIGLGAAGTMAVGSGSDIAVLKSTITDTKALAQAYTQITAAQRAAAPYQAQFANQAKIVANPTVLADYQKLVEAIKQHGINSTQAATADTNLSKAVHSVANPQLTSAFSAWQSQLSGVSSATAGLSAQMQAFGNTAGAQAELGLAKSATALNAFWDSQTSAARVAAVNIGQQFISLAHTYVPLVAAAAQQNLTIINSALKPLFAWLQGIQGQQIFQQLEQTFAQNLPTAVHAFTQAMELLLRVTNIASQYTGGFVRTLDSLFTRWNSLSNTQLSAVIAKFVDDFRLWEHFVKLLISDVYQLFHQDVGTGNSIIALLDQMLQKLHDWETSARGSAQIQNVFLVHRDEILLLIKALVAFGQAFAHIYLAIAPAFVGVMNSIVLPVLTDIAKAIGFITEHSSFAAVLLGLTLVASKMTSIATVAAAVKSLFMWLTGASAGAAAAGAAAAEAAGAGGLGAKMAAGFSSALRLAIPVLGAFLAASFAQSMLHLPAPGEAGQGSGASGVGQSAASGAIDFGAAGAAVGFVFGGPVGALIGGAATAFAGAAAGAIVQLAQNAFGSGPRNVTVTGQNVNNAKPWNLSSGDTANIKEVGNFAHYSLDQLQRLQTLLQTPGLTVKLNGVDSSAKAILSLISPAISTKAQIQANFNEAQTYMSQFWRQATAHAVTGANGMVTIVSPKLGQIQDAFKSSTRAITNFVGQGTAQWKQLMAQNISDMAAAVTTGMATGVVNVKAGLGALKSALASGLASGAITWQTQWQDMFTAVQTLYDHSKISTKSYFSDLKGIVTTGWQGIQQSTASALATYDNSQKVAFLSGQENFATYQTNIHNAQTRANTLQKGDLNTWVGHMVTAMQQSGRVTAAGTASIITQLDKTLGPLGVAKIPVPTYVGLQAGTFAAGGLVQVGRPGEAGRDTVPLSVGGQGIVVGAGEQIAVFNRHQQAEINQRLSDEGGLEGFFASRTRPHYMAGGGLLPGSLSLPTSSASGSTGSGSGYVYPFPGLGWGRTDQGVDFSGSGPLYAIGPGKVVGGSWGWSPGGGGLVYQLTGGPKAGSNVYYMENVSPSVATGAQISAGQAIASVAGVLEAGWANSSASGPLTPYNGAADGTPMPGGINFRAFLQALQSGGALPAGVSGTGSALGAVAAKVWNALTAPKVKGSGALADIMRAEFGKVTSAANAYGQKATAKWNAANAGAGASVGGTGPAAWMAAATQIAGQHGWDASQVQAWLGIERLEDGSFSLTATNPSSGAYGLAQFINGPGEYAQYGGNATTLTGQLTAMANYIAGRYGTPSAAYAYELAHHSYARGGLLRSMAQGGVVFDAGMSIETDGVGPSHGDAYHQGQTAYANGRLNADLTHFTALYDGWRAAHGISFGDIESVHYGGKQAYAIVGDSAGGGSGIHGEGSFSLARALGIPDDPNTGGVSSGVHYVLFPGSHNRSHGSIDQNVIDRVGAMLTHPHAQKSGGKGGKGSQHKHPSHHKKPPDTNPRKGHPGAAQWPKPPLPELPGPKKISDQLRFLNDHLAQGSTNPQGLQYLSEQMAYWPSIWGVQNPTAYGIISSPGQAIITTDPKTGQPVSPHVDEGDLSQARDWLGQEIGWQAQIVRDIQEAIAVSTALAPEVRAQIEKRQDEIKHVRSQIKKNLEAAKDLQAKIAHNTKWISRTRKLLGAVPTGTGPSQGAGATKPDSAKIAKYKAHIKALTEQSHDWAGQIEHLTDENEKLGGKSTTSPQATGGKIGQVGHQISKLKNVLGQVADPSGQWSPDALAGVTGVGGQLGTETVTLATLRSELAALSGPNIATQLKIAKSSAGQGSSSQLAGLLAQQLRNTETDLQVSQSQFATLEGFEPSVIGRLVGSFQSGIDFVDRTGLAIVHRGEKITPDPEGPAGSQLATVHTSSGPQEIIITMASNEMPLVKVIDARIGEKALPIVREQSGRRARVMAGVTRRP